ncbi:MAG: DUF5050 domain-containing protein [Candidatus Saccharicenans sp.]
MKKVFIVMVFCGLLVRAAGLAQVVTPVQKKTEQIKKIDIVEPTAISLNKSHVYLFLRTQGQNTYKEGYQLKATVIPDNATSKAVIWESSDPNVVTVDNNGNLIPVKHGQAVITATTKANGLKARCEVRVEYPNFPFGNSFSHLANSGYMAVQNDWIYFANPSDNMFLYKMKLDGSGKQRLNSAVTSYINVSGGKIFYLAGDYYVESVDIYGENVRNLTPNTRSTDVLLAYERVYYRSLNPDGGFAIYHFNFEGQDKKVIDWSSRANLYKFYGDGNWFIYSIIGNFTLAFKKNSQDMSAAASLTSKARIFIPYAMLMSGVGGTVAIPTDVYLIDETEDSIKRVGALSDWPKLKIDTLFRNYNQSMKINTLALAEGWLFYTTETILSKMRPDGTQNQVVIANLPPGQHYIFPVKTGSSPDDLWIYVYTRAGQGKFNLIKVRHNGMDRTVID